MKLLRRHRAPAIASDDPPYVQEYLARGYALVPGVLTPDEVAELRIETDRLLADYGGPEGDRGGVVKSGAREDRLDPIIDLSPRIAALARDPRVLALARAALHEEPLLLKDKLIAKPPGATGYRLHQDHAYWQMVRAPAHRMTSVSLCLDDTDSDNGAVEVFPGCHQRLLTRRGKHIPLDAERVRGVEAEVVRARAGDALLLHPLAPHRSGRNDSDRPRRQLFFSYSAASLGDLYARYYDRLDEVR